MECEFLNDSRHSCEIDVNVRRCVHQNAFSCSIYKDHRCGSRAWVVLNKGQRHL